jgi:hypothetical protein
MMPRTRVIGPIIAAALVAAGCGGSGPAPPPAAPAAPAAPGVEHPVGFEFANEIGPGFRLQRLDVLLDDRPLYTRTGETGLAEERRIRLAADLPLPAGEHTLTLHAVLRGDGQGVFAYLKEYKFTVRSSHRLQARPGLVVTVRLRERPNAPIEQRPHVTFEEALRADR